MEQIQISDNLLLYKTSEGEMSLDVRFSGETVWLSQTQMAQLFGKDRTVINRHIRNIYKEGELSEGETCANFAQVSQHGSVKGLTRTQQVPYYNLDVIISVGYRVKSREGVAFRKWANSVLREYLMKGYAISHSIAQEHYEELRGLVQMLGRTLKAYESLTDAESRSLLEVVVDYTYALDTLDQYDHQTLALGKTTEHTPFYATYELAIEAIQGLKDKFGGSSLFANEKDDSFRSSIGQIYQTFDGVELYPSVEEKAAMLLYLVTKNHSFSDGNKRIAAMLFLWFLEKNGVLYNKDRSKRLADSTLVALTLMIAESKTEDMEMIVRVVVNLISRNE